MLIILSLRMLHINRVVEIDYMTIYWIQYIMIYIKNLKVVTQKLRSAG